MNEIMVSGTLDSKMTPIEILLQVDDDGTVSARNVYSFLDLAAGQFSRWAKTNIVDNTFAIENEDFKGVDINVEGNVVPDYRLSVPFAKKLCMKAGGERGEQARDYFIKVEENHRDTRLALNSLSPQLQALIGIELRQSEMEKKIIAATAKVEAVENTIATIKDTIIQRDADWRAAVHKMFNNAVEASGTGDYQAMRRYSYEVLEQRAHCNLNVRLRNLKDRLSDRGATKTQINSATKMDVIEDDPKLREIYTSIIKEFSIRYMPPAQGSWL